MRKETEDAAMNDDEEIVLEIRPSPVRRWMAILALSFLGFLMIKLAFDEMPDLWRLFFVLLGGGTFWAAYRLRLATMDGLVLTRAGLRTISGKSLAGVEDVARVDRGALAFRPPERIHGAPEAAGGRGMGPRTLVADRAAPCRGRHPVRWPGKGHGRLAGGHGCGTGRTGDGPGLTGRRRDGPVGFR